MANKPTTQLPKRTEADELVHSLRNITAALEGGLRVLEEACGDEQLVKSARTAMRHQVDRLKDVVEQAARMAKRPPRND